jgi:putative transposase
VSHLCSRHKISQRRACGLASLSRSTCRYQPRKESSEVEKRLKVLAAKRISYGYRRLYHLLKREGYEVNHKRVYALYKRNGLAKRRKKKKRYPEKNRNPLVKASKPNEIWAMDFMTDSCSNGRKIRTLNIIDQYARECLKIEVGHSMPSCKVVRVLEEIAQERGLPEKIVIDNGPEYTSKTLKKWAESKGVSLNYINPGRPMENAYIESFNGKFREECLNQNWFQNILEAAIIVEEWRKDYNNNRPHSSLGYLTPIEYLRERNTEKPGKVYL